jgi:hypothetical protein
VRESIPTQTKHDVKNLERTVENANGGLLFSCLLNYRLSKKLFRSVHLLHDEERVCFLEARRWLARFCRMLAGDGVEDDRS